MICICFGSSIRWSCTLNCITLYSFLFLMLHQPGCKKIHNRALLPSEVVARPTGTQRRKSHTQRRKNPRSAVACQRSKSAPAILPDRHTVRPWRVHFNRLSCRLCGSTSSPYLDCVVCGYEAGAICCLGPELVSKPFICQLCHNEETPETLLMMVESGELVI